MSGPQEPSGGPPPGKGASTARRGTPVPVDLTVPASTRATIALFLAGPIIWTAHFGVVYLALEAGCTGDGPGLDAFDPPVPTALTLTATAIAAAACLATAALAYRRWRSERGEAADPAGPETTSDSEPADQGATLAFAGMLLSLLGFITVLFVGLPALVLPGCGP